MKKQIRIVLKTIVSAGVHHQLSHTCVSVKYKISGSSKQKQVFFIKQIKTLQLQIKVLLSADFNLDWTNRLSLDQLACKSVHRNSSDL